MGFDKAALTFKAVFVVYEAVDQTQRGPVKLTVGLRFALAYLYTTTGKLKPDQCKRFVSCLAERHKGQTDQMGHYMRRREAQAHLTAIMVAAGIEPNLDNETMIRNAFAKLTNQPPPNAPDGKSRIP